MGGGVLGLNADSFFRAEVRALVVFVVHVELRDVKVFVYALVVALHSFRFGEFAMDGGAFGGTRWVAICGRVGGGSGVGVGGVDVRVAVAGAAGTAAGIVAGKFWRRLGGERVLGRSVGGRRGFWSG